MIILGIDPGYQTGLALVDLIDPQRPRILAQKTVQPKHPMDVFAAIDKFGLPQWTDEMGFAVQVPFMPGNKVPRFHPGDTSGISISKNAAMSYFIWGLLEGRRLPVTAVPPKPGMGMKMSEQLWRHLFQFTKRISEHARDAAMLALNAEKAIRIGGDDVSHSG